MNLLTAEQPQACRAWVVSLTPFCERGELDEVGLERHLRRMAAAGLGVFVGSSNAGEGFTLTSGERDRVFEVAVRTLKGVVPVRSGGCEPQSLGAAIEEVRAAERAGLDAAHVFPLDTGHAGPPTAAELEAYYRAVIESTSIPLLVSNYPAMGYALPGSLLQHLLQDYPHLIGVRDAGGDIKALREFVAICRGRAEVQVGGIRNLVTALHHGSQGFICAEINLAPRLGADVVRAWVNGCLDAFHHAHERLWCLHETVSHYGGAAGRGIKPMLRHRGLPGGYLRPPRRAITEDELLAMERVLASLDIAID